jgi:chromosome segregation ATPase
MKEEYSANSESEEINDEINFIKTELKKYQDDSADKDKINSRYEQEVKKKDIQIDDLKNKIEEMKNNLAVKTYLEEHQTEEIENQAKKIAELEIAINENKSGNFT